MHKKTIIVPHDFTSVADNALSHAITVAKTTKAEIQVLHIVSKEKNIKEAEAKLEEICSTRSGEGITLVPIVRVGNIFDDIGDLAAEHHSELIIMGTHGLHGWQHITGSHALKVITHSSVPFIVVQERGIKDGYNDIVVPLDLNKETKQKLAYVANIATYFNSRIHVITPDETDEFLRHQVKANIQFAIKFFHERGIDVTTKVAPSSGFDKEIVKHAVSLEADLIAIMNLNRNNMLGVITANHEQYILTNDAQIPTMIINPIEGKYGGSVLFS